MMMKSTVNLIRECIHLILNERSLASTKDVFNLVKFRHLASTDENLAREYLEKHTKYLGAGSSRVVLDTGLGYVIKVAASEYGIEQIKHEISVARKCLRGIFTRIYAVDPKYRWIATEKARTATRDERNAAIKKLINGEDPESLFDFFEAGAQMMSGTSKSEEFLSRNKTSGRNNVIYKSYVKEEQAHVRLLKSSPWYKQMFHAYTNCGVTDLAPENWGFDKDNNLVLLDAGT